MVTDIIFGTKKGKVIRIDARDVRMKTLNDNYGKAKSRKPKGVKAIELEEGDEVVSVVSYSDPVSP